MATSMQTEKESIQTTFLNQVKRNLSPNLSFVDELAEALNISRDSAYRRIRGETILSLDEAKTLYNRFGVSIDVLFSNSSEMVTFHRRVVSYKDYNLEKWLGSILKNLDHLKGFERNEMIFSAKDIPVFHYFRLPELAAFKLFFWMKTLLGYPAYEQAKFSKDLVPKDLIALGSRIGSKYSTISSTEIWNEEVLYDTLRQIEFYNDCGMFANPEEAVLLCDQLSILLEDVEAEAEVGRKAEGGAFNLYNNEILIADNTVYARMGDRRCVYVNQNALNLLLTFQEPFCEKTEIYLQNLIKKSTLISITGQRERVRFFKNMRDRVLGLRNKFIQK
jgi:transcriptional regulator with XRE-family HTH domain